MSTTIGRRSTVWTIRPAEPGDAGAVARLFRETFGKPAAGAWYRWKVLETPWPLGAPRGWVAVVGDRIIGHYGGTPLRFRLGSDELRVLHGCDVMTVPEFRRQGVLTALGEAANRAWADAGAALVIGLPTPQWGSRRHHFGYRTAFSLGWLWRPLRADALVPRRLRTAVAAAPAGAIRLGGRLAVRTWNAGWTLASGRRDADVTVGEVERPGSEFDTLWERLRDAYEAGVVRDRAWVEYRFAGAPLANYRVLLARRAGEPIGYLAFRLISVQDYRSGWIADLFTAPADGAARGALIDAALARLRAAGAHDARAFAATGAPVLRSLWRAGFLRRSGTYDVALIQLAPSLPWEILGDPNRWLFAAGDSDVL